MNTFFTRAWHILSGAALSVIGLAGSPAGANLFGQKWSLVLTSVGTILMALGVVHADGQKPPTP
jgi:hypothetical protein